MTKEQIERRMMPKRIAIQIRELLDAEREKCGMAADDFEARWLAIESEISELVFEGDDDDQFEPLGA